MRKSDLNQGFNHIDNDLVEEFIRESDRLSARRSRNQIWVRALAVAACLALLAGAIATVALLQREQTDTPGQSETDSDATPEQSTQPLPPVIPFWDEAMLSAEQVAAAFYQRTDDVIPTSAYEKIKVADTSSLHIPPMMKEEYLEIYENKTVYPQPDPQAFRTFVDSFFPALANALGEPQAAYEIVTSDRDGTSDVMQDIQNAHLAIMERENCYTVSIATPHSYDPEKGPLWKLDSQPMQVDPTRSDEQLLASLQGIKESLFAIFDTAFSDVSINRQTDDTGTVKYIYILFYNRNDHALNGDGSLSDSIALGFELEKYATDGPLRDAFVYYTRHYQPAEQRFTISAYAKRISTEQAAKLLAKGYVFGGHACQLCQEKQDPVVFDSYDYVGMTYQYTYDYHTWREIMAIPFYVFYKQIGVEEDGKLIFARTYVPAIEVSDYETYFTKQQNHHVDLPE